MTTKRDYYDILGVSKSASADEIKRAYRKLAMKFHPDVNKTAEAESKFKEVSEAYQVLSDTQKKQKYDQFGHAAFDPSSGFAGFGGAGGARTYRQGPFSYSYSTNMGDAGFDFGGFGDPFDIFEQIFGGGFNRSYQQKPRYSLKIDFMEAVNGTERSIIHQGKEHSIKIPKGVDDGNRIRFGDFDVTIDVMPHQIFKREGYDVFVDHTISFPKAALGGNETIPTLDGQLTLKIRSGTQSGTMMRLRGKGVPHVRGAGAGDLYIRLYVDVPKNLNRKQRKLVQELEKAL